MGNKNTTVKNQVTSTRMSRRCSEFRCKSSVSDATDRVSLNAQSNDQKINRRRSSSIATVGVGRNNTLKPKRLAPRQCNLIIKSWSRTNKSKIGKDIFETIFNEIEELKSAFGISLSMKGKRLRSDPAFISHTDLFIDTFDFVIRHLDDLSLVIENAECLGRRHANLNIDDFKPEYWGIFRECIIENVSNEQDRETQIAWRQLILILGYDRELREMTRASSNRCITPIPTCPINGEGTNGQYLDT